MGNQGPNPERRYRDPRYRHQGGGGGFINAEIPTVVNPIGDSRVVGLYTAPTWRKRLALPGLLQSGLTTDADGLDHDGTSGADTGAAAIIAACAASAALVPTPSHALLWLGVNDEFAAVAPATTRTNLLAHVATLIGGANAPKVIVVREPRVRAHLPQVAPTTDGRTRGIAAWQRNGFVDVQVALGLTARVCVADPGWIYPTDYYLGYDFHQSNAGAAHLATTLWPLLRVFPGLGATPRATQQAALTTALGADLLHGFDGRDAPTEVAGLMSQWAAFVGGESLVQATAGTRPTWTGGAAEVGGKHMTCGDLLPASRAWTIVVQCQPYTSGSAAQETMVTVSATGVEHVAIGMTATSVAVEVEGAARRTIMEFPYAYAGGIPVCITATYDAVSQAAAGSYTCRANGVDLGAPTLTYNNAANYSSLVTVSCLGAYYRSGAAYQSWQAGTIDAVLVAEYGLSTAKRDALETFAAAVLA